MDGPQAPVPSVPQALGHVSKLMLHGKGSYPGVALGPEEASPFSPAALHFVILHLQPPCEKSICEKNSSAKKVRNPTATLTTGTPFVNIL